MPVNDHDLLMVGPQHGTVPEYVHIATTTDPVQGGFGVGGIKGQGQG